MNNSQNKFKDSNFQKSNNRFYKLKNRKIVHIEDKHRSRKNNKKFKTRITIESICPICEKRIEDIVFSMSFRVADEDRPVHFDCAFNKIKAENNLLSSEQLVYKGVGKFFIVDTFSRGNNLPFKIIKEIDFENSVKQPEWRKKILKYMSKSIKFD